MGKTVEDEDSLCGIGNKRAGSSLLQKLTSTSVCTSGLLRITDVVFSSTALESIWPSFGDPEELEQQEPTGILANNTGG